MHYKWEDWFLKVVKSVTYNPKKKKLKINRRVEILFNIILLWEQLVEIKNYIMAVYICF